jgi:hypothetical protein
MGLSFFSTYVHLDASGDPTQVLAIATSSSTGGRNQIFIAIKQFGQHILKNPLVAL